MRAAPSLVWGSAIGTLAAADLYADRKHNGSTLSEVTRALYHTEHPLGRAAFVASWVGLTVWFVPHICKTVTPRT